jgi:large subunit ribosomal protein L17
LRHRKAGNKLNRDPEHRVALKRNLTKALFEHHRIITTVAKAKVTRPFAERLITLAREVPREEAGQDKVKAARRVHNIRRAVALLGGKVGIGHLFDDIGPHFKARNGGYTRILRLAKRRIGDGGERALLELVDLPPREREAEPIEKPAKAEKPEKE